MILDLFKLAVFKYIPIGRTYFLGNTFRMLLVNIALALFYLWLFFFRTIEAQLLKIQVSGV